MLFLSLWQSLRICKILFFFQWLSLKEICWSLLLFIVKISKLSLSFVIKFYWANFGPLLLGNKRLYMYFFVKCVRCIIIHVVKKKIKIYTNQTFARYVSTFFIQKYISFRSSALFFLIHFIKQEWSRSKETTPFCGQHPEW